MTGHESVYYRETVGSQDIAAILGADVKRDGYYEGAGYRVTWTFGHLCTLKEPADYTDLWKRWSLGALPMLPQRFGIKLIPDAGIERQFNVIRSLIAEADEVINCGDAGREGELIQRWVMQLAETRVSGGGVCGSVRLPMSRYGRDSGI